MQPHRTLASQILSILYQSVRSIIIVLFCLLLSGSAFAQASPPQVVEAFLARDDGKGNPGIRASEFAVTDIPIHCVVVLRQPGVVDVKMNFVAVSVAGVKRDTRVVTAGYTTTPAQDRINFTGRPAGKWITGEYRVDLFVNWVAAGSLALQIKATAGTLVPAGIAKIPAARRRKPIKRKN